MINLQSTKRNRKKTADYLSSNYFNKQYDTKRHLQTSVLVSLGKKRVLSSLPFISNTKCGSASELKQQQKQITPTDDIIVRSYLKEMGSLYWFCIHPTKNLQLFALGFCWLPEGK